MRFSMPTIAVMVYILAVTAASSALKLGHLRLLAEKVGFLKFSELALVRVKQTYEYRANISHLGAPIWAIGTGTGNKCFHH